MSKADVRPVDSEAIAVLLGAVAEKVSRAATLGRCAGGWAIHFEHAEQPVVALAGRTQYAAVLRAVRFYLKSDCYRGGRAEEQVQRTARDILAGRALPPGKRLGYRKKTRKKCKECGRPL